MEQSVLPPDNRSFEEKSNDLNTRWKQIKHDRFFVNDFQEEIWKDNYQYQNESIVGTMRRLVKSIYKNESDELKSAFFDALINKRISFGGRVVANMGTDVEGVNPFNCYAMQRSVKPVDSIKNIYTDLHNAAEILKTEGGCGYDFSHLRPRGTFIKGIRSATPGVIKFMELWDKSSEIITQSNPGEHFQQGDLIAKKKIRKGAQIAVLTINHPDIIEYIESKNKPKYLEKFNISVSVTDDFMKALNKGKNWDLWFPDVHHEKYDDEWDGDFDKWASTYPDAKVIYKTMPAQELWDLIIHNTWKRNDPGLFFIDNANKYNNLSYTGRITGTNPCGEITMIADPATYYFIDGKFISDINKWCDNPRNKYEGVEKIETLGDICNLGHLNLVSYHNPELKDEFDWDTFQSDIYLLIRALDNIIDLSTYPLPGLENAAKLRRKLGAGLMGYGSLLIMKRLRYGSKAANKFTEKLEDIKANYSYQASALLARDKGPMPLFDLDQILDNGFIKNSGVLWAETRDMIWDYGLRNMALNTDAPTGNTGIYMGLVSGGIEPGFDLEYYRWAIVGHKHEQEIGHYEYPKFWKGEWFETKDFKFKDVNGEEVLESTCGNYRMDSSRGLIKKTLCIDYGWQYIKDNYSESEIATWKKEGVFATAMELSVEEHLTPFKIFSKYTDNSISKTINVANDYPEEDFSAMFIDLWKSGARGVTTYREGSATMVLESANKSEVEESQEEFYDTWKEHHSGDITVEQVSLPLEYPMQGYKIKSEGKKWYFHVAFKDEALYKPFAIFVQTNHRENEVNAHDAITHLMKLARIMKIPKKHRDETEHKYSGQNNVAKITRTIGMLLRHNVPIKKIVETLDKIEVPVATFVFTLKKFLCKFIAEGTQSEIACEQCEGQLIYEAGCILCKDCGWSKC